MAGGCPAPAGFADSSRGLAKRGAYHGKNQNRRRPARRAKKAAAAVGYSSVEEFVAHCIEKSSRSTSDEAEGQVADQLRGLGYIE